MRTAARDANGLAAAIAPSIKEGRRLHSMNQYDSAYEKVGLFVGPQDHGFGRFRTNIEWRCRGTTRLSNHRCCPNAYVREGNSIVLNAIEHIDVGSDE